MSVEVRVPTLGESVTEADIGEWFKKVGDSVDVDEPIVSLETDKAAMDVSAPSAGTITKIEGSEGDTKIRIIGVAIVIQVGFRCTGGAAWPGEGGEELTKVRIIHIAILIKVGRVEEVCGRHVTDDCGWVSDRAF